MPGVSGLQSGVPPPHPHRPVDVQHGMAARPHEAHVDGSHTLPEDDPPLDPLDEPDDELLEDPPLEDEEEDDPSIDEPPSRASASSLSAWASALVAEPASAESTTVIITATDPLSVTAIGPLSRASVAPASGVASGATSKSSAVNGAPPQPRARAASRSIMVVLIASFLFRCPRRS